MSISQSSNKVVCPFCEGISFTLKTNELVSMTTTFICEKCGSVLKTKDGETFTVSTVSETYSNTVTFMQGRKLTRDKLSEPGLPILSDADLVSISMGEGEFFERIINETEQNVPIILKQNERVVFWAQNVTLSEERSQHEYPSNLQVIDSGSLVITTKRYVFLGGNKSVDHGLSKITAIKPLNDGMGIVRSNKQKMEYYRAGYHWPVIRSIFMGVVKKHLYLNQVAAMPDADSEVLAALTSLGYSVAEARAAIQSIPKDAPKEVEERLRITLQYFQG